MCLVTLFPYGVTCIILGLIIFGAATSDNFLIFLHSLHSFKYFENVLTVWISHAVPNNVIIKVLTCLKKIHMHD